jgi:hypothetical protein
MNSKLIICFQRFVSTRCFENKIVLTIASAILCHEVKSMYIVNLSVYSFSKRVYLFIIDSQKLHKVCTRSLTVC